MPDVPGPVTNAALPGAKARLRVVCGIFLLLLLFPDFCYSVNPTDTLITTEGDRLIGEIKDLDRGLLTFETDATGKVPVKWDHVASVTSPRFFRVQLTDGSLFFGTLATNRTERKLIVILQKFRNEFPMDDVVEIERIKTQFWDRIDINLSVGVNYSKGSGVGQGNLAGKFTDRRDYDLREIETSFVVTTQREEQPTQKYDVSLTSNWHLGALWFANAYAAYQRNTELGVSARYIAGGGGGKYLIHMSSQYFFFVSGLFGTFEQGKDSLSQPTTVNSAELLLGLRYALFRYNTPKTDLETYIHAFPRVPQFDRLRLEYNLTMMWEIVEDLTWNVTFYDSYDTKPPSGESAKNDFGVNVGIGWSF